MFALEMPLEEVFGMWLNKFWFAALALIVWRLVPRLLTRGWF